MGLRWLDQGARGDVERVRYSPSRMLHEEHVAVLVMWRNSGVAQSAFVLETYFLVAADGGALSLKTRR